MSSPILITGATGNVGAPLVKLLRAEGAAVRPAARRPADPKAVRFDFADPTTWAAAFVGVQTLFLVRPPQLANIARGIVPALAAAVLRNPADHSGRIWTPTGQKALTYTEVADQLSAALGRTITYRRPGAAAYFRHARTALGMEVGMAAMTVLIHTAARLGAAGHLTDDVRTVTGRAPTTFAAFAHRERSIWEPLKGSTTLKRRDGRRPIPPASSG